MLDFDEALVFVFKLWIHSFKNSILITASKYYIKIFLFRL
jgi:hypothetical protein